MQARQDPDDGVGRSAQQIPPQAARAWVARVGPGLGERLEDEAPLVHPRVRDDEAIEVEGDVAVEQHVEVDHPVRPMPRGPAPEAALQVAQRAEEVERRQPRAHADDRVVEALRRDPADGRRRQDPAGDEVLAEVMQTVDRELQGARAVPEGRAEGDRDVDHGGAWRYTPIARSR